MKYEITKGNEKDFEGAPESATVRIIEDGFKDDIPIFADKFENGSTRTHCYTGVYDSHIADASRWTVIAERRPITEPVWDGEGLPPAGVECEIKSVADWCPVTIKFISGYYTVILTLGGTESVFHTSALQFRPIPVRSLEDVARHNTLYSLEALNIDSDVTVKIYDAIAAGKIPGVKLEGK